MDKNKNIKKDTSNEKVEKIEKVIKVKKPKKKNKEKYYEWHCVC